MNKLTPKCIKVSDSKQCPHCYSQRIVKNGKTRTGKQQYVCRNCSKRSLDYYSYRAYSSLTNNRIVRLIREGCGVRGIARLLHVCCATVKHRILLLSASAIRPTATLFQSYEVDELCTFIGSKVNRIWIAYGYCQESKEVVDFVIGSRSKAILAPLVSRLLHSYPQSIYTDRHQTYTALIPPEIHSTKYRGTNHIERKNLTLRTHLKRLARRTICFSRSENMLSACLKIYFWG